VFRWLKRARSFPPFSAANPGRGVLFRAGFSRAEQQWSEEGNVLDAFAAALGPLGIAFERSADRLTFANGLIARPQFVNLVPQDDGSVRTATTIEINHATLCPAGLFEYQYASGATIAASMQSAFASWAETDLPVLLDALLDKPERCTTVVKDVTVKKTQTVRRRQILFGPTLHMAAEAAVEAGVGHDFCPCCLFTNCADAFVGHVGPDEFYGLRLFASRDQQGTIDGDCRINGVGFPAGRKALMKYAATWPDRGFEFRKQFVAIRTLPDK